MGCQRDKETLKAGGRRASTRQVSQSILALLITAIPAAPIMGKLGKLLKKAMVISMEDQISYCNKTIQVGPHVLVVTTATVDTSGEGGIENLGELKQD